MPEFFLVYVPGAPAPSNPAQPRPATLALGQTLGLTTNYPWAPPQALALAHQWFPQGLTEHGIRYLLASDTPQSEKALELLWEAVRHAEHADAPSRLTSIFALPTHEDAEGFAPSSAGASRL